MEAGWKQTKAVGMHKEGKQVQDDGSAMVGAEGVDWSTVTAVRPACGDTDVRH